MQVKIMRAIEEISQMVENLKTNKQKPGITTRKEVILDYRVH